MKQSKPAKRKATKRKSTNRKTATADVDTALFIGTYLIMIQQIINRPNSKPFRIIRPHLSPYEHVVFERYLGMLLGQLQWLWKQNQFAFMLEAIEHGQYLLGLLNDNILQDQISLELDSYKTWAAALKSNLEYLQTFKNEEK